MIETDASTSLSTTTAIEHTVRDCSMEQQLQKIHDELALLGTKVERLEKSGAIQGNRAASGPQYGEATAALRKALEFLRAELTGEDTD